MAKRIVQLSKVCSDASSLLRQVIDKVLSTINTLSYDAYLLRAQVVQEFENKLYSFINREDI